MTATIHIGVAGWAYADWKGPVYPPRAGRDFHPLRHLAGFLDCVEVNSSFYALPQAAHAARWVELVADRPDFRFLVKLYGGLTHEPLPRDLAPLTAPFAEGISPLVASGRLMAVLAQFPVTFRRGEAGLARLGRLREALPDLPLVLELRHRSWFEAAALERVADLGYGLAHIDLPAARDHPPADHPSLGALGYLRLHGRNAGAWFRRGAGRDARYHHDYTPDELAGIAERMRRITERVQHGVVITNNHYGGHAVANALELKALLQPGRPSAPAHLLEAFPRLGDVVTASGQLPLWEESGP